MGVQVRIVLYAASEQIARVAAAAAFSELARLDRILSDYLAESELSRLSAAPVGEPVRVSEELFDVLERGIELSRRTDGAFDVTAGPLTDLWRRSRDSGRLPNAAELERARARSGWQRLRLDVDRRTATHLAEDMRLDVGGIGKGYALDRALAILRDRGIDRALIEAGGDIIVGAAPPGADGWRIAIDDAPPPRQSAIRPPTGSGACTVSLVDAAIAASGATEQFVEIDGVRYSHVVDPRTGLGTTDQRSTTVIAADGLTADGLATALTLLEEPAACRLLALYPETAALVRRPDARDSWSVAWPACRRASRTPDNGAPRAAGRGRRGPAREGRGRGGRVGV